MIASTCLFRDVRALRVPAVLLLLGLSAVTAAAQQPAPARPVRFDSGTISGLTARNIGSAEMSGRVSAVTAVEEKGRLAVFVGALGVYGGYPFADPIIGILITVAILRVVWDAGAQVLTRVIDGVDPSIAEEIKGWTTHIPGVSEVSEIRVRWIGHRIRAEVNIAVAPQLTVEAGHAIAKDVRHHLLDHLSYLDDALVHVDPLGASGEEYHYVRGHDY